MNFTMFAKKSDREVAKFLNDHQVDIAVDLAGYTRDCRPGIFAHRPAPIQVNYMGLGTMGADFIDYIIADAIVLPVEQQAYYTEKVVYLPDCYMANDTKRIIAGHTATRQEMGLPEHAFVFCCFTNNWKITPEVFDVWLRLLHQVEGSVLWLLGDNDGAVRNLRKEAQRGGIDPSRLVLAGWLANAAEHLARYRLADLFLDTLPYNANTTASEALWVGLPLLTRKGEAFAGRIAASLLHAAGISELITSNLEEYQAFALKLARDQALLAEIKAKLFDHRHTYPLFDTVRFSRHIEAAYTTMWETWQRGEAPRSFSVEPIDDPQT